MVYIYEHTSGTVTTLTGAADPFETQEEQSEDVFTPIRSQTGYLRIIDESGSQLEQIVPSNNTEKLVRLYSGTYNGDTFVDGTIRWQGFVCAEAFTQAWDGNAKMIEIPVKSLLGALDDVPIEEANASLELRIGRVICNAFDALQVTPERISWQSSIADMVADMFHIFVRCAAFFSEENVDNEGDVFTQIVGKSYAEALEGIMRLYGVCLRENGSTLEVAAYDKENGALYRNSIAWDYFDGYIANGSNYGNSPVAVADVDMLNVLDFAGSDNEASYIQGGRNAKVELALHGLQFKIELPLATESEDTPVVFELHTGRLYIQPHPPRHQIEDFIYPYYLRYDYQGTCTYPVMLEGTLFEGYIENPYYFTDRPLYTGAFPIRWMYQDSSERVVLKNGLYLNTQYRTSAQHPSGRADQAVIYRIDSAIGLVAQDGWIRINFTWHNIIWYDGVSGIHYLFDDASAILGHDVRAEMHMCIRVGDKWWNGTSWVTGGSAPGTEFWFNVINNSPQTNKTSDMNINETDGFFIPVSENLEGSVSFYILNYVPVTTTDSVYRYCYSHILHDLSITHVRPISIVASERGSNTYRKQIIASGFSEDKTINVGVGTINNNVPSAVFLKKSANEYLTEVTYNTDQGTTKTQRPELNLLDRMVAMYGEVRRTFTGVVRDGVDIFTQRFTYLNRKFFGITFQRDWARDTDKLKFIEVT